MHESKPWSRDLPAPASPLVSASVIYAAGMAEQLSEIVVALAKQLTGDCECTPVLEGLSTSTRELSAAFVRLQCMLVGRRGAGAAESATNGQGGMRSRIADLTKREREVLNHIVCDPTHNTNKAIARKLNISPRTVECHRHNIMKKLHARSVHDLLVMADRDASPRSRLHLLTTPSQSNGETIRTCSSR